MAFSFERLAKFAPVGDILFHIWPIKSTLQLRPSSVMLMPRRPQLVKLLVQLPSQDGRRYQLKSRLIMTTFRC